MMVSDTKDERGKVKDCAFAWSALDLFEPNSSTVREEGDTVEATTRYVFATAMGGRLFFSSMGAHSAAEVALIFNPNTGDRMIHTTEELAAALRKSAEKPLPMLWLWIAGGVEEEARRNGERLNGPPP